MTTAAERGYDAEYHRIRRAWAQVVAEGQAFCSERVCLYASRWIAPGASWHLAHSPDRTMILGPAHARCNLSEAGRRGNPRGAAKRRRRRKTWRPASRW